MPDASIAFEGIAKPILVAHALFAVALAGSAGHLSWECIGIARGKPRNVWLARTHARVGFVLYSIVFTLGLLAYPTYRVRVRHDVFDRTMPWASNLFDTKEMFAAFGLAAFAAVFALSFAVRPKEDEAMRPAFAAFGLLAGFVVFFDAVVGLILVTFRSL